MLKKLGVLGLFFVLLAGCNVQAADESEEASGSMLDFYADFPSSGIQYGKAPFDDKDGNGHDSGPDNGIVRSFDSATYNLNVTANPTIEGSVDNVVVRVWGTLDNAITPDGRVNAVFSERAEKEVYTNYDERVSGVDFTYRLDRVGEAVSLPIDVSVQGAHDGLEIKPQLQIQVVQVDGKDVTGENIKVDLTDQLPSFKVTSQVSIQARVKNVTGGALQQTTAKGALDDPTDPGWYRPVATEFVLAQIPGRPANDMRGATFPTGKIDFEYELYGVVDWWGNGEKDLTEPMKFSEIGDQVEIAHFAPITGEGRPSFSKGADGLRWEDRSFKAINFGTYETGRSKLKDFKQATIESAYIYSVWDSGTWNINPFKLVERNMGWGFEKQEAIIHEASVSDYVIGYTFPTRRADGGWLLSSNERTVYDGLNMDPRDNGGRSNGKGEPVFSTQVQLIYMPNAFRHGGPANPDNRNNEETYRARVKIKSYEDRDGTVVPYEKYTNTVPMEIDNRGGGTISVNQSLKGSTMQELDSGLFNPLSTFKIANESRGDSTVTTGDAQLVQGNNAYVNGYLRTSRPSRGGVDHVYRWNTDTFEVTSALASLIEKEDLSRGYEGIDGFPIQGDKAKASLSTRWGVAKFTDNHFESFMGRGQEDYMWFDSFDEATKTGPVGARMIRVTEGTGAGTTTRSPVMPLFVRDQTLGSVNKKGTPHLVTSQGYVYFNGRDRDPSRSNYSYQSKGNFNWENGSRNFTIYNDQHQIQKLQNPVGSNTPIATLAIVPGSASGTLRSERSSMYSNETVKFTGTANLMLPGQYDDNSSVTYDPYMTVEHTLPAGLRFIGGSGLANGQNVIPTVRINENQTQTLIWRVRLNGQRAADFSFDVSVNPFGLSSQSSQRLDIRQDVKHALDADMDARRVALRSTDAGVNVLRIGLVGVHGELNPTNGSINEGWNYTLRPYTTMQDEKGVRGVFTLPYNGDKLGSKFTGTLSVEGLEIKNREDVKIWVNKQSKLVDRPDQINLKDGWEEWSGQKEVKAVYYEMTDVLKAEDRMELIVKLKPQNNAIGDRYIHQSNVNSDTAYRVSPVTERERFEVTPDVELGLERIRIDTDQARDGLIAQVEFSSLVYRDRSNNDTFDIILYEIDSDGKRIKQVASYKSNFGALTDSIQTAELKIPPKELKVNDAERYEAVISGYDKNKVQIFDKADKIDTIGYTASERKVSFDSRINDDIPLTNATDERLWTYEGVVRTERYIGQEMQTYYEYMTVHPEFKDVLSSGYGFEFTPRFTYRNELNDLTGDFEFNALVDSSIVSGDYSEVKVKDPISKEEKTFKKSALIHSDDVEPWLFDTEKPTTTFGYHLPEVGLDDNGEVDFSKKGAGERLFVPIWVDQLGTYPIVFESSNALGVNKVDISLWQEIDLDAYMFGHLDSETLDKDALLIEPSQLDVYDPFD